LPGVGTPPNVTMIQNNALGGSATHEQTSVTDEPSVANVGNDIFYTGNFYASLSTDGGNSWSYLNPGTAFPNAYGGFCCDQRVLYVPSVNLVVWALLYNTDSNNDNEVRVAIAHGASGLAGGNWTYYDFTYQGPPPCDVNPNDCPGLPQGVGFDYPQLAYSAHDFYLTADLGNPDGSFYASIIYRCPLSDLASGQTVNCTSFFGGTDTFTPVDGASTTMYWADHADTSHLDLWSWPEDVDWQGVGWQEVAHSAFATNYSCASPDGTDMCGFEPQWSPVHGGWLKGNVLAFQWDAGAGPGGLGNFPFPYIHVVEINATTMSLIDEPIVWSPSVAYSYAGSAINQTGNVALSLAYGGGGHYPGSALMIRYNANPTFWQPVNVQEGTKGPPGNRWGDFLTARTASDGQSWLSASFVLQGACSGNNNWDPCGQVQPRFQWFASCRPSAGAASGPRPSLGPRRIYLPLVVQGTCVL
jgi:hypothetical protein